MTMPENDSLNPHPAKFDRFLYAPVGEDRNGYVVTVLSALARLGLDPWNETAELTTLGRDAARARLGLLLSRFRDVPALGRDHGSVARELTLLLPDGPPLHALTRAGSAGIKGSVGSSTAIWAILAVVLILVQVFSLGTSGSGQ